MSSPGRKAETAPDGQMMPREAAEILGVSKETVKKYIRDEDGPLSGTYWKNDAGEIRYYADIQSVHTLAAQRQESKAIVKRAGELHGDTRELFIGAINRQREEVVAKLAELLDNGQRVEANQEQILSDFGEAIQVLREAAEKEDAHQRKTREHEQKLVQHQEKLNEFIATFGFAMAEYKQIESERRKRELEQRRPWWRKLLGIR